MELKYTIESQPTTSGYRYFRKQKTSDGRKDRPDYRVDETVNDT
ncbi:MAG: hypothetical protein WBP08_02445 [Saprospiraceae bacterium]